MIRLRLWVAGAALFTTTAAAAVSGCFSDDCECPAIPDRPEAQDLRGDLELWGTTSASDGGPALTRIKGPEGGRMEITRDAVVIVYSQDGVEHRITYDVLGPVR